MKTNSLYLRQLRAGRKVADWLDRHNIIANVLEAAAGLWFAWYIFMYA